MALQHRQPFLEILHRCDREVGAGVQRRDGRAADPDSGVVDEHVEPAAAVAVRRDERGRGLARALLVDAFEVARAHGGERSELSTDSRTGALGLYQKVGMQVTSVWRHWAADVTPDPVVAPD